MLVCVVSVYVGGWVIRPGRLLLGGGGGGLSCNEILVKVEVGKKKKERRRILTVPTGSLEKQCLPDSLRWVIREFRIPALTTAQTHTNEHAAPLSNLCNY